MAAGPFGTLETLVDLGVDRTPASGQDVTALEGAPLIAEPVHRADARTVLLPGDLFSRS